MPLSKGDVYHRGNLAENRIANKIFFMKYHSVLTLALVAALMVGGVDAKTGEPGSSER